MAAAPEGLWSLPPEQRVLCADETSFGLQRVASELTVVMSTSVGDFTPSTDTIVTALESLQANIALRWCRKLLVFDCVPSSRELQALKQDKKAYHEDLKGQKWEKMWNEKREAYAEYCKALRAMKEAEHPALFGVELLFLGKFGHLLGTVKLALQNLTTPFVFITQHDLRLATRIAAADVQSILEALHSGQARYIVLNRDVNSGQRTQAYFRMLREFSVKDAGKRGAGSNLTGIAGFSDQAHFADAAWYRQEVLGTIPPERQLTCMEHVLHERWKHDQEWRGTFLYGDFRDGPFVYDLVHGVQVIDPEGKVVGIQAMPNRPAPS